MSPNDEVIVAQTRGGRVALAAGTVPFNDTLKKENSKVYDHV
ncbi:hypothetical protein [Arthrobacter sp. AL12]|nr:hypothetical protein [Arthrobacter sp. AL12]MDI3212531.1 hypothetical protein [Arthrobacter sp. AL12]